jgi:hypothetical protein
MAILLHHLRGLFLLCLAMLCLTAPAHAESTLSGSETAAFQHAFALWLEGDEAEALPVFATLAHEGNVAARVLLGLIDKTAALQGPYLTYLPRAERIALLRQPGGLSGQNWMVAAATDAPLAQLWSDLWQMRGGVELAEGFSALGEERACRESLIAQVARQERGFAPEVIAEAWFPESLQHLTVDRALDQDAAETLPEGHPMRAMAGLDVAPEALRAWLGAEPVAQPLRGVCETACPETAAACTHALYLALGSYHSLAILGSPAAMLLSDAEFSTTPRGHQSVARRIMLMHPIRIRESKLTEVAEIDACSADWLRSQYVGYKPTMRKSPVAPN